jgi:hypothetical protein
MKQQGHTPTQTAAGWRCSFCGDVISRIEDGWVEWLATERTGGGVLLKGLRLVHRSAPPGMSRDTGCRYDFRREFHHDRSIVEGLSLERFVGPDGLMLLLSFLAAGELPKDDVLELTKRVQIPGYEQTHELFREAVEEGVVTPAISDGYYLQYEMQQLLGRVTSSKQPSDRTG